ncbi:MAG: methyltransferase domain-containing protein [Gaiellales bacterium]|nr:MAG: methyltransferase domain-containing protein [Gaiellales bacterium]
MKKNSDLLRDMVRQAYGSVARAGRAGGGCCGGDSACDAGSISGAIGYSAAEMAAAPAGANLGLGCGNPTAIAGLKEGETVLDLGSGAGFDCFLAARQVGPAGRVIGVDMTPEMIARARENAAASGVENVEFRLGEIERLPVEDASVDVVISNCVINLSPAKEAVFGEIARVLKPGGRLAVSDMVLVRELPEELREDIEAWSGCISGAVMMDEYLACMEAAGLKDISITSKDITSLIEQAADDPLFRAAVDRTGAGWLDDPPVVSADIEAVK